MKELYDKLIEIRSRLPRQPSKNNATLISNLYSEYEEILKKIIHTSDFYNRHLFGYGGELPTIKGQIDRKKYIDAIDGMRSDIEFVISMVESEEKFD